MKRMRGVTRLALALLVSSALVFVLVRTIDTQAVAHALASAQRLQLLFALAATIAAWVLMALKWRTLVHEHISATTSLSLTFRSLFYGFVLPGQVASDIYRSIAFMNRGIAALGMASVITDRVLGLLALVLVGLTGALLSPALRASGSWTWVLIATTVLGIFCLVPLFALPLLLRALARWSRSISPVSDRVSSRIHSVAEAFASFPFAVRMRSFLYSVAFQALCVVALFCLGEAFRASVSLADWAWIFAIASVLLLIPVSIGGIGVREGTLVGALGVIGVAAPTALPIGVSLTLLAAIGALAGACLELASLMERRR